MSAVVKNEESASMACKVYPARVCQKSPGPDQKCVAARKDKNVIVENAFLRAEISGQGVILSIVNKATGKRHVLCNDQVGFDDDARVELIPRVDCRLRKIANIPEQDWLCPLFFADITPVCRWRGDNDIELVGFEHERQGVWSVWCLRKSNSGACSKL